MSWADQAHQRHRAALGHKEGKINVLQEQAGSALYQQSLRASVFGAITFSV